MAVPNIFENFREPVDSYDIDADKINDNFEYCLPMGGGAYLADDPLTASTSVMKFAMVVPRACSLKEIRIYAYDGPSGGPLTVDCHKNGTTVFTNQANRPSILDGQNAATSGTPDVVELAAGDRLEFYVDVNNSGKRLSITAVFE